MRKWKHLRAVLLLPGTATLVIPATIVLLTGKVSLGWGLPQPYRLVPPLIGGACAFLGLLLLFKTVALFEKVGGGTLAPWDPTQRLVVRGVYRRVRNPMISGVVFVLAGEAAIVGSLPLLYWSLLFFLVNAIYIPLSEERGLRRRFGDDYLLYKRNVPRWIPRLTPWTPPFDEETNWTLRV